MFYVRNFKNFKQAELDLDQPVTLLIGPNGSGKSNLIEAVELLAFLAQGRRLHEVTDIGREGGIEIRGGLEGCARIGQDEFTLGFRGEINTDSSLERVDYELTIRVRPEARVVGEILKVGDRTLPVFEVLRPDDSSASGDNQVRYDNRERGGKKPIESISGDRSGLSQYSRFALKNKELPEALNLIGSLMEKLERPRVFDPLPRLMRSYERRSETTLARNGYNISPVLYNLHRERRVIQRKAEGSRITVVLKHRREELGPILRRISQLPDEPFSDFTFSHLGNDGDVMFAFKSSSGGTVEARLVSDGTLRALGILTALETSSPDAPLILEEFDNGVHPSRVGVLVDGLFDAAGRRKLKILATTHNPSTMNTLEKNELDSVLLAVTDKAAGGARLVRLADLPDCTGLLELGRLGDLVTRRVYESHLAPDYEEQRKAGFERWVAALP